MGVGTDWVAPFGDLSGEQLWLAAFLLFLIIFFFGARYWFAPGTAKLAKQQGDEHTAITILQSQTEKQEKEIAQLRERMAAMETQMKRDTEYNREYRHALANREHTLGFSYDAALELLDTVLTEVPDVPQLLRKQRQHFRTTAELRASIPLPKENS